VGNLRWSSFSSFGARPWCMLSKFVGYFQPLEQCRCVRHSSSQSWVVRGQFCTAWPHSAHSAQDFRFCHAIPRSFAVCDRISSDPVVEPFEMSRQTSILSHRHKGHNAAREYSRNVFKSRWRCPVNDYSLRNECWSMRNRRLSNHETMLHEVASLDGFQVVLDTIEMNTPRPELSVNNSLPLPAPNAYHSQAPESTGAFRCASLRQLQLKRVNNICSCYSWNISSFL